MENVFEMVPVVPPGAARFNITWNGNNGFLPDPVPYDSTDEELRRIAAEAIAHGGVPGIVGGNADVKDFVLDRFPADAEVPFGRIFLRPKTPYGRL